MQLKKKNSFTLFLFLFKIASVSKILKAFKDTLDKA